MPTPTVSSLDLLYNNFLQNFQIVKNLHIIYEASVVESENFDNEIRFLITLLKASLKSFFRYVNAGYYSSNLVGIFSITPKLHVASTRAE